MKVHSGISDRGCYLRKGADVSHARSKSGRSIFVRRELLSAAEQQVRSCLGSIPVGGRAVRCR